MVTMDFATLVVAFEVALMISMVVNATKEDRVSRIGPFLLGFIGEEFKETRRTLLQNLTGSAAFRSGAKKGFSEEDLDAATDDPAVVEAVNALLNEKEATDDEISE